MLVVAGFHYVVAVVAYGRAACRPGRAIDSAREVAGLNTNDDGGGDTDGPSSWNEADSFAVTTNSEEVRDTAGPDDDGTDAGVVLGSPNAARGNSPMRGKGSLAPNLPKAKEKREREKPISD